MRIILRHQRVRTASALTVTALAIAACGSGDDSAETPADSNSNASTESASTPVVTDPSITSTVATDSAPATDTPSDDITASEVAPDTVADVDGEGDSGVDPDQDELALRSSVASNAQWADNVTITLDDDTMLFESDGLPSHEYLDVYLGDGRDGKFVAGGVEAYDARFEIPLVPTIADAPSETPNGAIGVAISGAVFFDPYEGDGSGTVANDDNETIDGVPFIDACGGHPLPNAIQYHYHGIPFCITDAVDTPGEHSTLIGYLFDGHPMYGPQDVDGEEPTDLDECMGHVGPTPEFPDGVYHYHVSSEANYISECFTGVAMSSGAGRPAG